MSSSFVFVGHKLPVEAARHFFEMDPCGWPDFDSFLRCQLVKELEKSLKAGSPTTAEPKSAADTDNAVAILLDWMLAELKSESGVDASNDGLILERMRASSALVVSELATETTAEIDLPFLASNETGVVALKKSVSRSMLERLIETGEIGEIGADAQERIPAAAPLEFDVFVADAAPNAGEPAEDFYFGVVVSQVHDRGPIGASETISAKDIEATLEGLTRFHAHQEGLDVKLGFPEGSLSASELKCFLLLNTDSNWPSTSALVFGSKYALEQSDGKWQVPCFESADLSEKKFKSVWDVLSTLQKHVGPKKVLAINQSDDARDGGADPVAFVGDIVMEMHSSSAFAPLELDVGHMQPREDFGEVHHLIEADQ